VYKITNVINRIRNAKIKFIPGNMKDTDKNKQSNDNDYHINYRFSYLELVKINKALESLITVPLLAKEGQGRS